MPRKQHTTVCCVRGLREGTETPQELQHMLQELSDESRRMCLNMNIATTKVMVVDNTAIPVNNVLIENGTTLQPQGEPGQRDKTKNRGRLGGIRQTLGYLQKQPCHLPEETGVQQMYPASYCDIWCIGETGLVVTKSTNFIIVLPVYCPFETVMVPKWQVISNTYI